MENNKLVKIGDYVELKQGLAINKGTSYLVSDEKNDIFNLPLLRIADMQNNSFSKYISKDVNKNVIASKNDIIYTRTGQIGLAFSGYHGVVHNNSFIVSLINDKQIDRKYFLKLLNSGFVRNQALSMAKNSVQPDLTHDMFRNIMIPLPDLPTQKKIADVLSCIDDKIALNNKTNTELENMAKTIYDYWFTQFDFPDKNGHPYKTSGGQMIYNETLKREIPTGWEVKRLGDVCEIVLGGTPSTDKDEYWNGNIPWLNSGEVAEFPIINAEKTVTELGIKDSATELVPAGTVTLSITRHLRPSILTMDACINQSVVGIKENKLFSKNFLYPFIASKINHYMMLRTGAQQPHINKETVDDTLVCIPSAEVLENYNKKVGSIYERIILNAKETKQLTMLREYLLPLLMNGQITIKE